MEKTVVPYGRQAVTDADINAVTEVLRSDYLTQGPAVPAFEQAVADYCGAAYAVATNSATSALHIACLALGLGEGDWLWTSPNSFVASANCGLYCGAQVDFVDIELETGNLSAEALAQQCEIAQREGRLPKVVIPVHFAGQSCDMAAIHALGQRYGFAIIEDASHALGGCYHDQRVGACRYSDITVFSFHPVKMITSGEGGMALTQDESLAQRMRCLMSHGITRDPSEMTGPVPGQWYYQQVALGFNYRLSDIHAALGLSQMARLSDYVERRNEWAAQYHDALQALPLLPLSPLSVKPERRSSYHLYVVRIVGADLEKRSDWFKQLRAQGIGVNVHYIPIPQQPYYQQQRATQERPSPDLPNMARYYREALTLPLFATMTQRQFDAVMTALSQLKG